MHGTEIKLLRSIDCYLERGTDFAPIPLQFEIRLKLAVFSRDVLPLARYFFFFIPRLQAREFAVNLFFSPRILRNFLSNIHYVFLNPGKISLL